MNNTKIIIEKPYIKKNTEIVYRIVNSESTLSIIPSNFKINGTRDWKNNILISKETTEATQVF